MFYNSYMKTEMQNVIHALLHSNFYVFGIEEHTAISYTLIKCTGI